MKLGGSQGGEDTEGVGESKQEEKQPDFTVYNLDVLKNEIKSIETDLGKKLDDNFIMFESKNRMGR